MATPLKEDEFGMAIYDSEYPLIDADPHFSRVVRYMRPSDYLVWAGVAAVSPLVSGYMEHPFYTRFASNLKDTLIGYGQAVKQGHTRWGPLPSVALGIVGGFIVAYSRSSGRFLGVSENERERKKDLYELRMRVLMGKPLYGTSSLHPDLQKICASYSRYAYSMTGIIPIFNFVNHPYHGVDTSKYYKVLEK
ncbi:NADH-ubiquinone oxidoreductase complex I, 21 kDa subunit-domain-containing protein [Kockiozyma suomiensis]|uniref:NADH-ubiquinone oxidoreductase complex I, 21 kDa subunit-domain-containing protein n=1 Tax=Kockiozyma suomiensis TaxID=1337062 RepID=UPI003343EE6C